MNTTARAATSPSGDPVPEGAGDPAGLEMAATPPEIPVPAFVAALAADDKLGEETVVLAMAALVGVVDAFVITSGRNARHVKTLVEEIELQTKARCGRGPSSVEGLRDGTWVLMDYGDVVVHVFLEETRAYYDLEHLWSSAPRIAWRQAAAV